MYTRCFEKANEVINISEYGFETYMDNKVIRTGLVEPGTLPEIVQALLEDGYVEVL